MICVNSVDNFFYKEYYFHTESYMHSIKEIAKLFQICIVFSQRRFSLIDKVTSGL